MTEREKRFIDEKFPSETERAAAYKRLEGREPLAYILGEWYFYNETYVITPDVLIPRPDTELLVEQAIKRLPRGGRFIELCTGSGCISVSLLRARPDLYGVACDISPAAVGVARRNADKYLGGRLKLFCADITAKDFISFIPGNKGFDAILSNPPYIASAALDTLEPEVRAEPRVALDGGRDGLDFYRTLLRLKKDLLDGEGICLFEIGYDQAASVKSLFGGGGVMRDYGGNDRLFVI